jgi:anti-sigma B factor antagonist
MNFDLGFTRAGDVATGLATGELDMVSHEAFIDAVVDQFPAAAIVVVDVSGLTFMDSTGISALVRCRNKARELGREFLISAAGGEVASVLELTGLDTYFSKPDAWVPLGIEVDAGRDCQRRVDCGHGHRSPTARNPGTGGDPSRRLDYGPRRRRRVLVLDCRVAGGGGVAW